MSMAQRRVLLINPTIHPAGVEMLSSQFEIVMAPDGSEDTLIKFLKDKSIEALISRVEIINRKVIFEAARLRVIGQHGAGLDNIDVNAAKEKGIKIVNAPGVNAVSVAEHVIMLILGISRQVIGADSAVRKGEWEFRNQKIPVETNAKTLLILGFGAIGKDVAQKARTAFNMKVYAFDPLVSELEMRSFGAEKVDSINDVLHLADYISVHVPLMSSTKHMIGAKEFKLMKKSVYIINTSRGAIIDESALINALKEDSIAGAGLDVFENEPPCIDNELLSLPNVILSPHFAGDTVESKERTSITVVKKVISALSID